MRAALAVVLSVGSLSLTGSVGFQEHAHADTLRLNTTHNVSTAPAKVSQQIAGTPTTIVVVSPEVYSEWTKVAVCEEGGWVGYSGYNYPDSLGINRTNWFAYGGGSDLSPTAQIAVAERIEGSSYVPDQYGCAGAW